MEQCGRKGRFDPEFPAVDFEYDLLQMTKPKPQRVRDPIHNLIELNSRGSKALCGG